MVEGVVQTAQSYFYAIITSIAILLIGFGAGILAKKLFQRLLEEIKLNQMIFKANINYDIENIISSLIMYLIYLITIILSLNQLGITSIVGYILIGLVLLLVVLALFVFIKDFLPNFHGWLKKGRKLKQGQKLEFGQISGAVETVGLMETIIRTTQGDLLHVPNLLFVKEK